MLAIVAWAELAGVRWERDVCLIGVWYKYGRHCRDCMKYRHNCPTLRSSVALSLSLSLKTSLMRLDSVKSFLQINHLDVIIYLDSLLPQPTAPGSGLVFHLLSVLTLIRINESSVLFSPSPCLNWSYNWNIYNFCRVGGFTCCILCFSWFYPICWTSHYISSRSSSGQFCPLVKTFSIVSE